MSKTFVLISKSRWDEPPRLRHQIAHLLADAGHMVIFLEKPTSFMRRPAPIRRVADGIFVAGYRELVHHLLRLAPFLHRMNRMVAERSISSTLRQLEVPDSAVIVNFNYEYYFLREMFPKHDIVTIINDDHLATALLGHRRPLEWALSRTVQMSDVVLTVSTPLVQQLSRFGKTRLFLPWADTEYKAPSAGTRDTLLWWGYINDRLDYDLLDSMCAAATGYRVQLVGPVRPKAGERFERFRKKWNIEVIPPRKLDELEIDRVLAGLIPYRSGDARIDAIELSNKALQMLARGIPLLISGMPHFIQQPFIYRLDAPGVSIPGILERVRAEFDYQQPAMRDFVMANTAETRLKQFMSHLTGEGL